MTTQKQYFQSLAELEATVSLNSLSYANKCRFVADNLEPSPYTEKLQEIAEAMDEQARLKEKKSRQEEIYDQMVKYRAQQLSKLRSQGIEPDL
jgi:hypothetical protein